MAKASANMCQSYLVPDSVVVTALLSYLFPHTNEHGHSRYLHDHSGPLQYVRSLLRSVCRSLHASVSCIGCIFAPWLLAQTHAANCVYARGYLLPWASVSTWCGITTYVSAASAQVHLDVCLRRVHYYVYACVYVCRQMLMAFYVRRVCVCAWAAIWYLTPSLFSLLQLCVPFANPRPG